MRSSRSPSPSSRRVKSDSLVSPSNSNLSLLYDGNFPVSNEPASTFFTFGIPVILIGTLFFTSFGHGPTHGVMWAAAAIVVWFSGAFVRGSRMIHGGSVFWGIVTGFGLLYVAALASALTQPLSSLQDVALWLDPVNAKGPKGAALPEQSYGAACAVTWANVKTHCDIFVLAHVLGWVGKAIMFRDAAVSVVLSFLFEFMEYSFEYLLPNFYECWWDHWILDFLICNGLGILAGHAIMSAARLREYNWLGLQPVDRKAGLIGAVTGLHDSTLARDPKRAAALVFLAVWIMAIDLNAFFLKYMLRVLPASPLNALRLSLMALLGGAAMREYYAFLTVGTPFGPIGTLSLIGTLLETVVVLKFGADVPEWHGVHPTAVVVNAWIAVAVLALVTAALHYYSAPLRLRRQNKIK
jgi:phosphatidylserine synthase 2